MKRNKSNILDFYRKAPKISESASPSPRTGLHISDVEAAGQEGRVIEESRNETLQMVLFSSSSVPTEESVPANDSSPQPQSAQPPSPVPPAQPQNPTTAGSSRASNSTPGTSNQIRSEDVAYDADLLPHDPAKRTPILSYDVNEQDMVRRGFILKGPCQDRKYKFPARLISKKPRRFSVRWFDKYSWIEYSKEKDAAFCFVCYLFKEKTVGGDKFVNGGFRNWNRYDALDKHVGGIRSLHNQAQEKYNFFMKPNSSVADRLVKQSEEDKRLYKCRLTFSLRCLRFLLRQGLACRGHDESDFSSNKGNFLELLAWLAENKQDVAKFVLKNAPRNCKLTSPKIQKNIISCCAKETTRRIIEKIGTDFYAILADESSDVSQKEQLALSLRYVDNVGRVGERFLGVIHVADTTSLSLKNAIEKLLVDHKLSLSKIRGQGYDGASNMKGEIKGLKTLIMNESPSAYYIHCFAHQLQLVLVAVAKGNSDCVWFFEQISYLLNVIGVSCKRHDMLRNTRAQEIVEALDLGEIESGTGLNQEMGLARPGDTRWGSHYKTILHIVGMYSTIRKVLIKIGKDPSQKSEWAKAQTVLGPFESFNFVFMAHLMLVILGYTDELCQSLQKREQDIVNAMTLVTLVKNRLEYLRNDGWENFLAEKVTSFCMKHHIKVPKPNDKYVPFGRSKRFTHKQTNDDHFRREVFIGVIDNIRHELDNRFDKVNMELLVCMSALNPLNSFSSYDQDRVVSLAKFYPSEFSRSDILYLPNQLDNFIADMRSDDRFKDISTLAELCMKLVETNKHQLYKLVYLLIKLVLLLPVVTASVERVFSAMNLVKNKLRNSMGNQVLNDCLVTFIERDIFLKVSDEDVMNRFYAMKNRRHEKKRL